MVTGIEREAQIEQELRQAQRAEEPGTLEGHLRNEDALSTVELEGTGWVWLWDTRTGVRSRCNRGGLRRALQKTRPDGSPVFQATDPQIAQPVPTFPCILHEEHSAREFFAKRNMPTCKKMLMTESDAEAHSRNRHQREWRSYETARGQSIEEEERNLRRLNIESLMRMAGEPKAAAEVPAPEADVPVETPEKATETCECGRTLEAKTSGGLNFARLHHRKKCPVYSPEAWMKAQGRD